MYFLCFLSLQSTSKHILGMKPTVRILAFEHRLMQMLGLLLMVYLFLSVQALRFYSSCNVMVRGISIVNSPLCHLKFDNSRGIKISNITISSPEDSPNTDGIHLQNSQHVEIEHSNIGCGMYIIFLDEPSLACSSFFWADKDYIHNPMLALDVAHVCRNRFLVSRRSPVKLFKKHHTRLIFLFA